MYQDIQFYFTEEEEETWTANSRVIRTTLNSNYNDFPILSHSSSDLRSLLRNKFNNQCKNLIKFLKNRKEFLSFVAQYRDYHGTMPSCVPIELVCDCNVHLSVFELYDCTSLTSMLAWIPNDVFCIKERQVLLKILKYSGILMKASDELKADAEVVLKALEFDESLESLSFASDLLITNQE